LLERFLYLQLISRRQFLCENLDKFQRVCTVFSRWHTVPYPRYIGQYFYRRDAMPKVKLWRNAWLRVRLEWPLFVLLFALLRGLKAVVINDNYLFDFTVIFQIIFHIAAARPRACVCNLQMTATAGNLGLRRDRNNNSAIIMIMIMLVIMINWLNAPTRYHS